MKPAPAARPTLPAPAGFALCSTTTSATNVPAFDPLPELESVTNANGDTLVVCAVSNCDKVCCRRCDRHRLLDWVRSLQQPLLRRNAAHVDPRRVGSRPTPMETLWSLVLFRTAPSVLPPLATCLPAPTGFALYNNLCYDETQPSLSPRRVGVQTNANGDTLVAFVPFRTATSYYAAAAPATTCSTGFALYNNLCYDETQPSLIPAELSPDQRQWRHSGRLCRFNCDKLLPPLPPATCSTVSLSTTTSATMNRSLHCSQLVTRYNTTPMETF